MREPIQKFINCLEQEKLKNEPKIEVSLKKNISLFKTTVNPIINRRKLMCLSLERFKVLKKGNSLSEIIPKLRLKKEKKETKNLGKLSSLKCNPFLVESTLENQDKLLRTMISQESQNKTSLFKNIRFPLSRFFTMVGNQGEFPIANSNFVKRNGSKLSAKILSDVLPILRNDLQSNNENLRTTSHNDFTYIYPRLDHKIIKTEILITSASKLNKQNENSVVQLIEKNESDFNSLNNSKNELKTNETNLKISENRQFLRKTFLMSSLDGKIQTSKKSFRIPQQIFKDSFSNFSQPITKKFVVLESIYKFGDHIKTIDWQAMEKALNKREMSNEGRETRSDLIDNYDDKMTCFARKIMIDLKNSVLSNMAEKQNQMVDFVLTNDFLEECPFVKNMNQEIVIKNPNKSEFEGFEYKSHWIDKINRLLNENSNVKLTCKTNTFEKKNKEFSRLMGNLWDKKIECGLILKIINSVARQIALDHCTLNNKLK